ncbi:MAG: hypothetical protein ACYC3G_00580 [Minisyncoccota bacterium]
MCEYDGKLYICTNPGRIYVYDGSSVTLSYDTLEATVNALAVFGDKLYAATGTNGKIFVFDGSTWSLSHDSTAQTISDLTVYGDAFYAAGHTYSGGYGYVYKFDGAAWTTAYSFRHSSVPGWWLRTFQMAVAYGCLYIAVQEDSSVGHLREFNGTSWAIQRPLTPFQPKFQLIQSFGGFLYGGSDTIQGNVCRFTLDPDVSTSVSAGFHSAMGSFAGFLWAAEHSSENCIIKRSLDGTTWVNDATLVAYATSLCEYSGHFYLLHGGNGPVTKLYVSDMIVTLTPVGIIPGIQRIRDPQHPARSPRFSGRVPRGL